MPTVIDMDKISKKELANLQGFIAIKEIGKSKVELYFKTDHDIIVDIFAPVGSEYPELVDPNYWKKYDDCCVARFSLEKFFKRVPKGKAKKGYYHKYDLRKMMCCPHKAPCHTKGHTCVPVHRMTTLKTFSCACRPA